MLVNFYQAFQHSPEDSHLYTFYCTNLKSYLVNTYGEATVCDLPQSFQANAKIKLFETNTSYYLPFPFCLTYFISAVWHEIQMYLVSYSMHKEKRSNPLVNLIFWDLRFPLGQRCGLWFSGLWHHVAL